MPSFGGLILSQRCVHAGTSGNCSHRYWCSHQQQCSYFPHALQHRLLHFHFVLPASTPIWPVLSAPVAVYWCGIPSSCNPESREGIGSRESHLLVLSWVLKQQSCLVPNRDTRASSYCARSQNLLVFRVNQ